MLFSLLYHLVRRVLAPGDAGAMKGASSSWCFVTR